MDPLSPKIHEDFEPSVEGHLCRWYRGRSRRDTAVQKETRWWKQKKRDFHTYKKGQSLGILAHRTSEDELSGCPITSKRKVFSFHETILSFGEPGSLGNDGGWWINPGRDSHGFSVKSYPWKVLLLTIYSMVGWTEKTSLIFVGIYIQSTMLFLKWSAWLTGCIDFIYLHHGSLYYKIQTSCTNTREIPPKFTTYLQQLYLIPLIWVPFNDPCTRRYMG